MPKLAPPQPGTRLGPWIVDALIGTGGHAHLYLARHRDHADQYAALKVLISPSEPELARRLVREAELIARLDHPNIVGVHGVGTEAERAWVALHWVPGHPLSNWVRRPPRPAASVLEIGAGIADALATLHRGGLAHRDVKPANIMVRPDGTPVLIDFGLAFDAAASRITRPDGAAPTTARYAPPEWFAGSAHDPTLHDAYALGVVLWELLAGAAAGGAPREEALDPGPAVDPALRLLVRELTEPRPRARRSAESAALLLRRLRPADPTIATLGAPATPTATLDRIGAYSIDGVLGRGAMGVVYRAHRDGDANAVAIKMLPWGAAASESARRRLQREALAAASLSHPAVVKILESGAADGVPYVVMEYVEGSSLRQRLARGPLDPATACGILADIASALAHAHERSVVHRDVKPSNVLLDEENRPRLADFGIARGAMDEQTRLTLTGQLLGTPAYMAPEQARGESTGPPADVWALGIVLWEAVHGTVPWSGNHPAQILHQVLAAAPASRTRPGGAVGRVLERILVQEPSDRPSAHDVERDLRWIAEGQEHRVAGLALHRRIRLELARPRVVAGLALVVALLVGGASVGLWMGGAAWQEHARESAATSRLSALVGAAASWTDPDGQRLEEAIDAFVREPAFQDTRARAKAWLALGERLEALGQTERARTANARAYATASDEAERIESLTRLAESFHARWEWSRLEYALNLDLPESERLVAARRDLGAVLRRASETPTDATDDLVSGLRTEGTRTPWLFGDALRILDGERILLHTGRRSVEGLRARVLARDRELPQLYDCSTEREDHLLPVGSSPGGRDLFLARRRGYPISRLVECDIEGLDEVWSRSGGTIGGALAADLDGDGLPSVLMGFLLGEYGLRELSPAPGGWTIRRPHPPTDALESSVTRLLVEDLDADGDPELAVALGPWQAFEVQVLEPTGTGLERTARKAMGYVDQLALVHTPSGPQLAASVVRRYRSRSVFPDPPHYGGSPGVHLLRLEDGALRESATLELPVQQCDDIHAGDVDGDGLSDLAIACDDLSLLAHQGRDGSFDVRVLSHELYVKGAVDLDNDGDAELIAVDASDGGATWVLGAGDQNLPALTLEPLPVRTPPTSLPTSWQDPWRRAEDLVAWGLEDAAESELRSLAAITAGSETSTLALLRAGEVAEQAFRFDAAVERYAEAAAAGGATAARRARLDLLERQFRYRDALDFAIEQSPNDDPTWPDRLARLRDKTALEPITLDDPGLNGWEVRSLTGLRPATNGAWRVHASHTELLRRRVRWDGHPISVELDIEVHRNSIGASLQVMLIEPGVGRRGKMGLRVKSSGGGGLLFADHECRARGQWEARPEARWLTAPVEASVDRRSSVVDRRWRAAVYLDPNKPHGFCSDERDGARAGAFTELAYDDRWAAFEAGEYDLVIAVAGGTGFEDAWSDMTIHALEVSGVQALPTQVDDGLRHALTTGRSSAIEDSETPRSPAERALFQAVRHRDRGERELAREAMDRALSSARWPTDLHRVARTSAGWFDAQLIAMGERGWDVLARAWTDALREHPDHPELREAAMRWPTPPLPAAESASLDERLWLIVRRAAFLGDIGRRVEAEDEAQRVLDGIDGHPHSEAGPLRRAAYTLIARSREARRDRDGALSALMEGVRGAVSPEATARRFDRDGRLRPITEDAAWRAFMSSLVD